MKLKESLRTMVIAAHRTVARCGVHVVPKHFYSALADLNELEASTQTWARPSTMPGISLELDQQLEEIDKLRLFLDEEEGVAAYHSAVAAGMGLGYGYLEAKFLYATLRALRPARVLEVGGGVSTAIIAAAIRKNRTEALHVVLEPFPSPALKQFPGPILVAQSAQAAGIEPFGELRAGDFLFIDSSHAVKPGSDVNFLILDVLPRLCPEVTIHFHDITFPYDYQPHLFQTLYQWSETSLLHAFLINNAHCKVLYALSDLHHRAPEVLQRMVRDYRPAPMQQGLFRVPLASVYRGEVHFPSSIYLRTC